jgi:Tol biopolymer transport system component
MLTQKVKEKLAALARPALCGVAALTLAAWSAPVQAQTPPGEILFSRSSNGNTDIVKTIPVRANPTTDVISNFDYQDIAHTENGNLIVFGVQTGPAPYDVYIKVGANAPVNLLAGAGFGTSDDKFPKISPDGRYVVFASDFDRGGSSGQVTQNQTHDIYVVDRGNQNTVTRLTTNGTDNTQPTWASDSQGGLRVVWMRNVSGPVNTRQDYELFIANFNGTTGTSAPSLSNFTNLTQTIGNENDPDVSPDGTRIIFATNRDNLNTDSSKLDIYSMPITGGAGNWQRHISLSAVPNVSNGRARYPSYSPTGKQFAYWTDVDGDAEIYIANAENPSGTFVENNGITQITVNDRSEGIYDVNPCWYSTGPVFNITPVNATVLEGTTNVTTNATFSVSISQAPTSTVTVNYATFNGTATGAASGPDYTTTSGTLTWNAGDTSSKTITVPVRGDTTVEFNETFTVTLSSASSGTTIGTATATGTINDDDAVLSINDVTMGEPTVGSTATATFTVTASRVVNSVNYAVPQAITVSCNFATSNGTAQAPGDYTARTTTALSVTVPSNLTSGTNITTLTVTIQPDALTETNETFNVTLSSPTNATISDNTGVGTIIDNPPPCISIANAAAVNEGGTATFTVTLSKVWASAIAVNYTVSPGSAVAADYGTASDSDGGTPGVLNFPAGTTSGTVSVPIMNDTIGEPAETFTVTLSNPTGGATLCNSQATMSATGTINASDKPTISINNVSVAEGSRAAFTVSLSNPDSSAVTVQYTTSDGTALVSDNDYTPVTTAKTLTIPAGSTSAQIPAPDVQTTADTKPEANETFFVNLSGASSNATLPANTKGTGTITNDDLPKVFVSDVFLNEGDFGNRAMCFTIALNAPAPTAITVNYSTIVGTTNPATAGTDYTALAATNVTFNAGETSKSLAVTVVGDTNAENDETFILKLNSATNATITKANGIGTIVNDDAPPPPPPTISISDYGVSEGNSGTQTFTFNVTLSAASANTVTVQYATDDFTAASGTDYVKKIATTLTFPVGTTTQQASVTVNGDTVSEGDEKFLVKLSNPVNATIADGTGEGTIFNDDAPYTGPVNVSATANPASVAVNAPVTITTVQTDINGVANFTQSQCLINTSTSVANAVRLYYNSGTNKIYLADNAGTTFLGGITPGPGAAPLSNDQVTLDCANTTINKVGNTLTIAWRLTFKPSFSGTKNLYILGKDASTATTFDKMGTVTITP